MNTARSQPKCGGGGWMNGSSRSWIEEPITQVRNRNKREAPKLSGAD